VLAAQRPPCPRPLERIGRIGRRVGRPKAYERTEPWTLQDARIIVAVKNN